MFRAGQWVLFAGNVVGAHKTSGGLLVGIHHDGFIFPVSPTGENLPGPGGRAIKLCVEDCQVQPLADRNDIPAARLATYDPKWMPLEGRVKRGNN